MRTVLCKMMCGSAGLLLALLLPGCGKAVFPKQLFTIEVTAADYPVMLSRTQTKQVGRALEASSGTHRAQSQSSYSTGYSQVTVTHTEAGQSELSAADKLAPQVRRSDKWIQVERAVFQAEDYSSYGFSSADRMLTIQASAHQ